MEPFRAVDAHNGVLKAQNEALEGCRSVIEDSHHFDKKQDPDPR